MKSSSMELIIGCNIQNLNNWLYFTKRYNVIENKNENLVIEHLNLNNDNEVKKYMNWKNLRIMSKSQSSKKNRNLSIEDN